MSVSLKQKCYTPSQLFNTDAISITDRNIANEVQAIRIGANELRKLIGAVLDLQTFMLTSALMFVTSPSHDRAPHRSAPSQMVLATHQLASPSLRRSLAALHTSMMHRKRSIAEAHMRH